MPRTTQAILAAGLVAASLGAQAQNDKSLTIGTLNWAENIAVANMWKLVLEEAPYDYDVELSNVGKSVAFSGVASGDMDISLETWLPATDASYIEPYKDRLTIHDVWYRGAGMGLVVPSYVNADSIADLAGQGEAFEYQGQPTIVGIDPGSSISSLTEDAIEAYELPMQQLSSSEVAMMAALDDAYRRQEPMVVTLWSPHWAFAEYDLKYLDDPKGVYGDEEAIHWFSRTGFAEDDPWLAAVLNAWQMDDDSLGSLMAMIEKAGEPEEGARQWIDENRPLVDEWLAAGEAADQPL
ncbi:glycine betaine ABC transporter substrate-binding protein [Halomonas sp. McH1-25]|uniref:glycine betaine ABC transporter substrate-binding protein n=1 Tax=unclassified Halomonas TaxID=2609666 RepID=UPI001EF48262|nr:MULTISPECIES: glycine betaine ABC transporter substrate-binding protein [unclassified Halomonas]MCG7600285.1 glycine betaine ABC transporter substrate-binding protein [Halomonas sp. McH1-25]MCP1342461.1 glycine betaine ABC transporter substrate-binding protein [Halomonas sp. FL8]MCP1359602.1 glycine betaine ABC transporter substrate-binding protein [Halomonas sp. BBD45]